MTGLYLFAAAAGVPLVVWFLLSGSDDGADSDAAGGDDGIGGIMVRLFPLSTIALAVAMFGVTGLALGLADTSSAATLVAAIVVAVLAGALNTTLFSYLRRSDSTASVGDDQLAGSIGRVVMPIAPGRRGRVAVSVNDQQLYLSAITLDDAAPGVELVPGDPILVVHVRDGIAHVTRLDPELA